MSAAAERIIVFDGFCHLCSGWARFLLRHRVQPPFRLIAMQSDEGRLLLTRHGIDGNDPSTFLVLEGGKVYTESDGVLQILASLGGPWRCLGATGWVPRSWRNALYRLIARNRYRWFGRRTVCYLPDDRPS